MEQQSVYDVTKLHKIYIIEKMELRFFSFSQKRPFVLEWRIVFRTKFPSTKFFNSETLLSQNITEPFRIVNPGCSF